MDGVGSAHGRSTTLTARELHDDEAFSINIVRDKTTLVGSQNSGAGPLSVTLLSNALYDVFISYALEVPHGVDPSTSLTIDVALAIPEPGTASLLALGLVGLGTLRQKRH